MPELRPAQSEAVSALSQESKLLLADVGAGKTATAATAIVARGRKRTLVVSTVRICDTVWGEELAKWTPQLAYASAAGLAPKQRHKILEGPTDIVGLNVQNIPEAIKRYGNALPEMFPNIIFDECTKEESPTSAVFKALRPILERFEWRLPMTGTPRANHLYDIWGNVFLADCGKSLGRYREAFLQRWFFPVRTHGQLKWLPRAKAEQEIYDAIGPVVHRMAFSMPDPITIDAVIPLNPRVRMIDDLISQRIHAADEVVIDGVTYARNGKRVAAKELQLSSGYVYRDDGTVLRLHDDKLNALRAIVEEAQGEPMMVVYQFEHERDAILGAFPQARRLSDSVSLAQWNAGNIEMLLVHPLSCGYGLNAQFSGSDLQVWFSPTFDAELYTQTIGRMNRPGAKHLIRVMRLIMAGTKDRQAYWVVHDRQADEAATLARFQ